MFLSGEDFTELFGLGHLMGDRFSIGDLRIAHPGIYFHLFRQSGDQYIEMELPHSGYDQLAGVGVLLPVESGILLHQYLERCLQLVLIAHGLGFDGDRDHRFGKLHILKQNLRAFTSDGIAGLGILETNDHSDIAGLELIDRFRPAGMHPHQTIDPLSLLLGDIEDGGALLDHTRIDPNETERTRLPVVLDLEYQGQRLCLGVVVYGYFIPMLHRYSLEWRYVEW